MLTLCKRTTALTLSFPGLRGFHKLLARPKRTVQYSIRATVNIRYICINVKENLPATGPLPARPARAKIERSL